MFQYASDLHIDCWAPKTPFESFLVPSAPYLILAGDICSAWDHRYFEFLKWTSRLWHKVYIVAGNHEYHNKKKHTIAETDLRILTFCLKYSNLVYLQAGMSAIVPNSNIRIVGGTLWCAPDPAMWSAAAKKKGDYKRIFIEDASHPKGRRKLKPADVYALHTLHKILFQFALVPNTPMESLLVVSHYMPSKELLEPEFREEAWHTFYASNDDDLFNSNIKVWMCGHGHRGTTFQIPNGPLLAMNARGYNKESELNRIKDVYNPCAIQKVI